MSHSHETLEEWHSGQMELPIRDPGSRRDEVAAGKKCVVLRSLDTSLSAKIR